MYGVKLVQRFRRFPIFFFFQQQSCQCPAFLLTRRDWTMNGTTKTTKTDASAENHADFILPIFRKREKIWIRLEKHFSSEGSGSVYLGCVSQNRTHRHETANSNVRFRPRFAVGIASELIKSRRIARTRSDYASVLIPIGPDKDSEIHARM